MSHRRSPHSLLRAHRKRVRKQSLAVAKHLRQASKSTHPGHLPSEVHQLRTTLQGLRRDILRSGGGAATQHAADALGQLDTSLAKLVEASRHENSNTALTVLGDGMQAFDKARRAAKAAGHAWPL